MKDSWPVEMIHTYAQNPLLIISLLAVTLNCPLSVVAQADRSAPWINDFLGRGSGGGSRYNPIKSRMGIEVNAQNQTVSDQALKDLDSFTNPADRRMIALAITRLSTSLSRSGSLATHDRVLDISIALEVLYQLDAPEITYKLSTRAGWYLGCNANERLQIGKTMRDLYGFRSDIAHGRGVKKSDLDRIHDQALSITRDTLLKHLSRGRPPDKPYWDKIVMGHENPSKH